MWYRYSKICYRKQAAFTLIELLITLAVIAVLSGIIVPAFSTTMRRLAVDNATDTLQTSMMLARTEAIMKHCPVFIQASRPAWKEGWEIYRDCDGDALKNRPDDLLRKITPTAKSIDIRGNSQARIYLRFIADGSSRQKSGALGMASVTICPEGALNSPDCQRLTVNATGRVRRWKPNL